MDWVTTSTLLRDLRDEGEDAAWEGFVLRFRRPVADFARSLGLSPSDAEDVAQETLLAFADGLRGGAYDRDKGRLSKWLFGIAYRQVLRERRRRARGAVTVSPGDGDGSSLWAALPDDAEVGALWDRRWEQAILEQCLARVRSEVKPTTYRAFELVVLADCPAPRAAEALGVDVATVYNAKHRILKRIRELTARLDEADPEIPGENPP